MLTKATLIKLYENDGLSMMEIAHKLSCSPNQVVYWMSKHGITRRTISDAVYQRKHPDGHPFTIASINTIEKAQLYGLGIGLYWGEGTKANKHSVRLGNTDPELLKTFIRFLVELFGVNKLELRFGLQIFTDIDEQKAMDYWSDQLGVEQSQFYKVHTTISGSLGTYRQKSQFGVVTVYYHNTRLRDILVGLLPR